jgi:predicted O-linked N-acetylglucosamine transferase (SPINDLY family)
MGTPVITLLGDRHAGRVGCSILSKVGFTELIADNIEEYISTASRLSKDIQYLIQVHKILRKNFQSLMCNGAVFIKALENAYCDMWKRYCSKS